MTRTEQALHCVESKLEELADLGPEFSEKYKTLLKLSRELRDGKFEVARSALPIGDDSKLREWAVSLACAMDNSFEDHNWMVMLEEFANLLDCVEQLKIADHFNETTKAQLRTGNDCPALRDNDVVVCLFRDKNISDGIQDLNTWHCYDANMSDEDVIEFVKETHPGFIEMVKIFR